MTNRNYFLILCFCAVYSCGKKTHQPYKGDSSRLFTKIPSEHSKINFKNIVNETPEFNFLNYSYIYNGGGVAVGDINNDGLEDIYFTSNHGSNKLYLNEGNFVFKDITDEAEVSDKEGWSTGVTMVDINNDGWLDIYVCKSASIENRSARQNKLFINQRNSTFKESAIDYGLKEYGFSTQAYFFDYDKDGDLDMYLLNHSQDENKDILLQPQYQTRLTKDNIDKLFRNDNGKFKDVSKESNITKLGWGLSAALGDFNQDGWTDIFVANDFLEPDFLYINNQDGTFTDRALEQFKHISNNSMGSDFADINNDLFPDLVVLDMLASDRKRGKENMASMNIEKFNRMVSKGWHHQYMSNVLQLNNGDGTYSEIGQLSGIAKTDWSWAPLIADYNNDGLNDLFVTNGIKRDIANQDFRQQMKKKLPNLDKEQEFEMAKQIIPGAKLSNHFFLNKGTLIFEDTTEDFGLKEKVNSNGAAYADLDNDGDLDLIINNQADKALIYRNNSRSNYLKLQLDGPDNNKYGIGTKVIAYMDSLKQIREQYPTRGYQSSVSFDLYFGLGTIEKIDSLKVVWNDDKIQVLTNLKANQRIKVSYKDSKKGNTEIKKKSSLFETIGGSELGVDYKHRPVNYNDYGLQVLLPQKQSTIDNAIAIGDINNDGLDDLFVGNTMGFRAELYVQNDLGKFSKTNQPIFEADRASNDNSAIFFDFDNDGDLDLYVASGNYSLSETDELNQDRLYINNGKGSFYKGKLPKISSVTKAIAANDFDNDGDIDLFVGGRVVPGKYPIPPESYILENHNGIFINSTNKHSKEIQNLGLVNDAIFSDYDADGDSDLLVVGEFMNITLFKNEKGFLVRDQGSLTNNSGWYQCISGIDFDNDGDQDYFIGNMGKNNKFHPSVEHPLHIFSNYFDDNSSYDIALSKDYDGNLYPIRGKECSSEQTPFLKDKIKTYKDFANSNILDIYGHNNIDNALHLTAETFSSYYLENKGDGDFVFHELPICAQFGPTLDFEFFDVNKDKDLEVVGVGTIYEAEVETIRYDASQGYVLDANWSDSQNFETLSRNISGKPVKAIEKIMIKGENYLVLFIANGELEFLRIKNSN